MDSQKLYFEWISKEMKFRSMEDWYTINPEDIELRGGYYLLQLYGGSLTSALKAVYPHQKWHSWFEPNLFQEFWKNSSNQKAYLEWYFHARNLETMDDWYNVKNEDIVKYKGIGLLREYNNSLEKALRTVYPQHSWTIWQFGTVPSYLLLQKISVINVGVIGPMTRTY